MQLDYYRTSVIHLSLEDYTNAGLTQEEIEKEITQIDDPGSFSLKLRCTPSGLNYNLNVHTMSKSGGTVDDIVHKIKIRLDLLLWEKRQKEKK